MLPAIASSMSASLGSGLLTNSALADMIWPDWQYPHCGTSASIQAFWTGWLASGDKPSIVVTVFPATVEIAVPQDRVATPLI